MGLESSDGRLVAVSMDGLGDGQGKTQADGRRVRHANQEGLRRRRYRGRTGRIDWIS